MMEGMISVTLSGEGVSVTISGKTFTVSLSKEAIEELGLNNRSLSASGAGPAEIVAALAGQIGKMPSAAVLAELKSKGTEIMHKAKAPEPAADEGEQALSRPLFDRRLQTPSPRTL